MPYILHKGPPYGICQVTVFMLTLGHWMCCVWYLVGDADTDERDPAGVRTACLCSCKALAL